jgi:hypothetical protein
MLFTMMFCLTTTGPEAMEPSDHGLKTPKPQAKINSSSLRLFSQVFCHGDEK